MRLLLMLVISLAGAYFGQMICKEPWQIWMAGALTGFVLSIIPAK